MSRIEEWVEEMAVQASRKVRFLPWYWPNVTNMSLVGYWLTVAEDTELRAMWRRTWIQVLADRAARAYAEGKWPTASRRKRIFVLETTDIEMRFLRPLWGRRRRKRP